MKNVPRTLSIMTALWLASCGGSNDSPDQPDTTSGIDGGGLDGSPTDSLAPLDGGDATTPADGDSGPVIPSGPPTPIPTACAPEPGSAADDGVRVKSPAPQMRFTENLPFRILADNADPNAWMCPPSHPPYVCPGTEMRFYVDDVFVGAQPPRVDEEDHFELRLPKGLPKGDHVLTVTSVQYDPKTKGAGAIVKGALPVKISVDPAPTHGGTVTLTEDLVLTGATELRWEDKTVVGNGHKVTAAAGYSGKVIIKGSFVSGLADYDQWGLDVTTTGEVTIDGSTFEATAPLKLAVNGAAPFTVRNNELRSTMYVTYFASDPMRSPILQVSGNTTGAKTLQGNRFGGGIVRFESSPGWQVGGLGAGEGNVLIGPRAILAFVNSSKAIIQGNYDLHDYHGGWSQGFNLYFEGSNQALAEHNVIRSGSWPIQTFGGEFRYNLVVDSGHDWWRSARDDANIHHNVFVHTLGPDGSFNGGIMVYGGEKGLKIYNNTFDGGGAVAKFAASPIVIGSGSVFASIRNNVFTGFSDVGTTFDKALIKGPAGGLTYGDYNAWYDPLAPATAHYATGLVTGGAGAHDVSEKDPTFNGVPELPYKVSSSCVWNGTYTTAQVLKHYRELYAPKAGSPLVDVGDPADGAGTDIGAIGGGTADPKDLFGLVAK